MKKFFFWLMLFLLIPLGGLAWYNYTYDELGILNPDFSSRRIGGAENFVKMRYLLAHPEKYNAFAFGSSRIAVLNVQTIDDGNHWYNMTYADGLPAEWLDNVKYMLHSGVKINRLLIGLDDAAFRTDPKIHEGRLGDSLPYRPYDVKTYLKMLFQKPYPRKSKEYIYEHGILYDIYGSGTTPFPWIDEEIEQDPEKHCKDKRLVQSSARKECRLTQTIAELKELKELADSNGIEIVFYISPVYVTSYLDNNLAEFDEFKRQLSSFTDYYDFSGLNSVTTDPMNYYESSHYRPKIGDRIMDRIYRNGAPQDDGFGVYVTRENLEANLAAQHERQRAWEKAHPDCYERIRYYNSVSPYLTESLRGAVSADAELLVHAESVNGKLLSGEAVYTLPEGDRFDFSMWMLPGKGLLVEAAAVLREENGACLYSDVDLGVRPDVSGLFYCEKDAKLGGVFHIRRSDLPSGRYQLYFLGRNDTGMLLQSKVLCTIIVP